MPVEWMLNVALLDVLSAVGLFLLALSTAGRLRLLAFVASAWCVIEAGAHAWMENVLAGVL